jgi:hypothetical protein
MVEPRRALDAKNRASRTALQGLAIDILVAVALFITWLLIDAHSWDDLPAWQIIVFSLVKTILMAAASFAMRRWLDKPDGFLLPKDPPGRPADPSPR